MRRIFATAWAAAILFAGASLPAIARADATPPIQSWSDLHAQYDRIVDRVDAAQKGPGAIGGGPAVIGFEEEILRVYRTPSANDGFWTDFRDRYDRALESAERTSPRAAP